MFSLINKEVLEKGKAGRRYENSFSGTQKRSGQTSAHEMTRQDSGFFDRHFSLISNSIHISIELFSRASSISKLVFEIALQLMHLMM
jgi:hypothetical protein